ncbi:MAG: methylmalonyl Co-A mutase-associated GTPase MeaB [Flammeovirgaceae bacterium]
MKLSQRLTVEEYTKGIIEGNRFILSRAITLIESKLAEDQVLAQKVLQSIIPYTGKSFRIGITGVPGVGKSTFIESFGFALAESGKKLAVLAIDPSSQKTKGSIMGDKTRMEKLSNHPNAYVRPSPTGDTLGGVTRKTRETMLLCEASGYEIIIIETVGVGQSETAVRGMVDFFLLLMLAGAGDELQGIKKGIMEMADMLVITKADGDNLPKAKLAMGEYASALHLFRPEKPHWTPPVKICSSVTQEGLDKIWESMREYQQKMIANGWLQHQREKQNLRWLYEIIEDQLLQEFYQNEEIQKESKILEADVLQGKIMPFGAAKQLLEIFKRVREIKEKK